MRSLGRRRNVFLTGAIVGAIIVFLYYESESGEHWAFREQLSESHLESLVNATVHTTENAVVQPTLALEPPSKWSQVKQHYPVKTLLSLPSGEPDYESPKIQHRFSEEDVEDLGSTQQARRDAVKEEFEHAWDGYKTHAWLKDEVSPISGDSRNSFGGLAATLVDSLDSLWILGMHEEFTAAVEAVKKINFVEPGDTSVSLFEYTIRYLGGLLGAFEISDRRYPVLLEKAVEMGEMLYAAFDTPNRMPLTHFEWKAIFAGNKSEAAENTMVAELGSLSLEFTTLSRLTKDDKYYDAIQRVANEFQKAQNSTKLPGMWPVFANARTLSFSGHTTFTLGAMSDSLYEYLPKQHLLMNGATSQYYDMYKDAVRPIMDNLLFRPMVKNEADVLFSGQFHAPSGKRTLEPMVQHLGCFAGGMLALGAKIMQNEEDLEVARKLTDGCIWAYNHTQSGLMPEVFHVTPCTDPCQWDASKWHSAVKEKMEHSADDARSEEERLKSKIHDERLIEGYTKIDSGKYILRPEAIESVFYLYRITGDRILLDQAWNMFTAIREHTHTEIANAAIEDVTLTNPKHRDRMESFWLAETLKYFYLIFSDPSKVSLDEYVL